MAGLVYLGVSASLSDRLTFEFGLVSAHLVVALGLAWIGWHGLTPWPALGAYMRWSAALSIWFFVSSIAAWDVNAVYWSVLSAVWLVFIVPGIANLLRRETNRRALFVGILAAAMTYALTGLGRFATGRDVFDLPDPGRAVLLGVKRGLVNSRMLYVIPFLVANAPRVLPRLRWVAAAAAGALIVVSGGRAGLLGMVVVALVYVVIRPGVSQKLRAIFIALLLGVVFISALSEFGGQAVVGKNRLVAFVRGERTSSDDIREAHFKRAWRAGQENPVFGIGYEGLQGLRDDEAFQGIRNLRSRTNATEGGTHNTYVQVFGEFGAPGALLFLMLFFAPFKAAWPERDRSEVRAVLAGFAGVMVTMMFHAMALAFVYFPLAFLVGALGDESDTSAPRGPASDERTRGSAGRTSRS